MSRVHTCFFSEAFLALAYEAEVELNADQEYEAPVVDGAQDALERDDRVLAEEWVESVDDEALVAVGQLWVSYCNMYNIGRMHFYLMRQRIGTRTFSKHYTAYYKYKNYETRMSW